MLLLPSGSFLKQPVSKNQRGYDRRQQAHQDQNRVSILPRTTKAEFKFAGSTS
jgi:hypothetical protein